MPIVLDSELGEAALRAAAKAGFSNVAEGLLRAGVNPDALFGAALVVAEQYGDAKTIELLRRVTTPMSELFTKVEPPSSGGHMPLVIGPELGEAALRAAAKAGFSNVAEGLLRAGVNPDALLGAALVMAEQYGDAKTIELLRRETTPVAELLEKARSASPPPSPEKRPRLLNKKKTRSPRP